MISDCGFRVGDNVMYQSGEEMHESAIAEIVSKGHKSWTGEGKKKNLYEYSQTSIVKLEDGTSILDIHLVAI